MQIREARRLFAYTEWANARIVDVLRQFPPETLERRIDSSFPSIRATLAHIIGAEWIWLRRWKGESPNAFPEWLDAPLEELLTVGAGIEQERRELFEGITDADLERSMAYTSMKGDPFTTPFDDMVRHLANHSTYHRGQLTTMIRQAGGIPPSTDYVAFCRTLGG